MPAATWTAIRFLTSNMKNNRLLFIVIVLLAIWCLVLTLIIADRKDSSSDENVNVVTVDGFSTDFTKIVESNKSSVVTIDAEGTISSGFIYLQDGDRVYVVTAYHGVSDTRNIDVVFDSYYRTHGNVLGFDIYADICVLEIEIPFNVNPLKLGDNSLLSDGEFVLSIGTPKSLDYKGSVELGMVSSKLRTVENSIIYDTSDYTYFADLIQLSSLLQPGYSGSPLLNMSGEVVGVSTMAKEDGLSFAFPINEIKIIADKIIKGEEYHKLQLGISGYYLSDMPNYEKNNLNLGIDVIDGLYVNKVKDNNLGSVFGIKAGDVITDINGHPLKSNSDYLSIVYSGSKELVFTVIRGGERIELTGTINA